LILLDWRNLIRTPPQQQAEEGDDCDAANPENKTKNKIAVDLPPDHALGCSRRAPTGCGSDWRDQVEKCLRRVQIIVADLPSRRCDTEPAVNGGSI
jgi:hypothetical protein